MEPRKRIIFKNIINCRDLGGYVTEYGVTKFNRFIRCGIVNEPDYREIEELKKLNIKTVIDLRGDYETGNNPLNMDRLADADLHNISLYEANVANADNGGKHLSDTYIFITDAFRDNVRLVLETIADAKDGAVLYHCFFGKDRTGILTMLLLTIAGVDEDDIIADYQVTYTYLRRYIEEHEKTLWNKNKIYFYSQPETMLTLIKHLNKKYGSVEKYILSTGISRENILKIRRKFYN